MVYSISNKKTLLEVLEVQIFLFFLSGNKLGVSQVFREEVSGNSLETCRNWKGSCLAESALLLYVPVVNRSQFFYGSIKAFLCEFK